MKKFWMFLTVFLTLICFLTGCSKQEGLEKYVSELRSDAFYGETENFKLKAWYGFRETPYNNDGQVKDRVYLLQFRLLDQETSEIAFTVFFNYNQTEYSKQFSHSPISHALTAEIPIDNFKEKEFIVIIKYSDESIEISLKSILPQGTVSYVKALESLKNSKPELIKTFTDNDGNFKAEIHARIVVKDEKSYWYIAFSQGKESLKALLVDGKTCEVLAIREIF